MPKLPIFNICGTEVEKIASTAAYRYLYFHIIFLFGIFERRYEIPIVENL
jgi:hypothetical protein